MIFEIIEKEIKKRYENGQKSLYIYYLSVLDAYVLAKELNIPISKNGFEIGDFCYINTNYGKVKIIFVE